MCTHFKGRPANRDELLFLTTLNVIIYFMLYILIRYLCKTKLNYQII